MSLREDLQAAVTEAYALLSHADMAWTDPDGPDFNVLADVYDDLAAQGDAIMSYAQSLVDGSVEIVEARDQVEAAEADLLAAVADLRV